MALPVQYDLVTLTGKYVDILGNPLAGKQLRLSLAPEALVIAAADTIITPDVRVITLDINGVFSVSVPATDDPDVNPNGWTYWVEEMFGANRRYPIEVTRPGPHDMSDLAPVASSAGNAVVVGPGVEAGGTTGQVLAKASGDDYDTQWVTPTSAPSGGAGGALAGNYPSPGFNTTALDNAVAANVTDSSATRTALRAAFGSTAYEMVPAYIKGDSYASGGGGVDNNTRIFDRVFTRLRTQTPVNTGVSGQRCDQILMTQVVSAGWTANSRGVVGIADVALNDVASATQLAPAQTAEAFRSLLAYLTAQYAGGVADTGVIYGPGWTAGVSDGTAGRYADVAFVGDSCFLVFSFAPTGGVATVTNTSGTTLATVTTSGYTFTFNGVVKLSGFGSGAHSVRVATTSGTVTLLGYLIPSPAPPAVAWYKPGPILDAPRSARLATTHAALAPIAAGFSTVIPIDVDGSWDNTTMLGPDAVHLNDRGQAYAANLVESALRANGTWRQGLDQLTGPNAGTYTPTVPAYTRPGATAPAQVTGLTASTSQQALLSWTKPSDGGATITGWVIQYRTTAGPGAWTTYSPGTPIAAAATTATVLTGLTNGTSYDFQVAAVNPVGTGTYSTAATATSGPVLVTFAADSFTRADSATLGTTETGGYTWTQNLASTYAIASNRISSLSTVAGTLTADAYIDDAQSDGTLQLTRVDNNQGGIFFRGAGASDVTGWYFYANATVYVLQKRTTATAYTPIVTTAVVKKAGDVIKVVLNGSTITCYVNGTQVATTTDAFNQTATRHGVFGISAAALFDDFSHTSAIV